jgi:hypothetical protein
MMKSQLNLRTLPWHLIVIFLLLAIGIGTSGYFYYKDQKKILKKPKRRNSLLYALELMFEEP